MKITEEDLGFTQSLIINTTLKVLQMEIISSVNFTYMRNSFTAIPGQV